MDNENGTPKKQRIGLLLAVLLVIIAVIFDIAEIILDIAGAGVAGTIKDIAQTIFFPVVFFILKAPFWKGKKKAKKMISMITTFFVSYIPIISTILPEVAIGVALTIYFTRKEDKEGGDNIIQFPKNQNITRQKRERPKIRKAA